MTQRPTHPRLGVDLGGTKIEAAIVDDDGVITTRRRSPTPGTYAALLSTVADLCDSVEKAAGLVPRSLALGIGTPGSRSPADGRMRNCNSTVLNGRPLQDDLEVATGRAVRMANDADCFALSESRDGAAAGAASVFGVILGTGVGGGIVVNGSLLPGRNAIAGEWGHNRLPLARCRELPAAVSRQPRPCYCGADNCVETWLSGPGLAQTHQELHGSPIDAEALHRGAVDERLADTLDIYCELAATALAALINTIDPQVIVLGGGLSNIASLYERIPALLPAKVFSDSFSTPLRKAAHGDSGGVRGAAWLW